MSIQPNTLTVSRIALTVFFIMFMMMDGFFAKFLGMVVFIAAAVTDFYDGYLARKNDKITDFGKLMDPIADKFLTLAAFMIFVKIGIISVWYFLIIFAREIAITAIRVLAKTKGQILSAEKFGKYKTVTQMAAIIFILIYVVLKESPLSQGWSTSTLKGWHASIEFLMVAAVIMTLASGFSYIWNNQHVIYDKSDN